MHTSTSELCYNKINLTLDYLIGNVKNNILVSIVFLINLNLKYKLVVSYYLCL